MSKISTDPTRLALNGPTMGTRWTALFHVDPAIDTDLVRAALQAAVDEVDAQMSTWKPRQRSDAPECGTCRCLADGPDAVARGVGAWA